MNRDFFKGIGLSDHESEVYLSVMSGGKVTASGIAKMTGFKRSTVYAYIEHLLQIGLLRQTIQGKRRYFVAENPLKLRHRLVQLRSSYEEQLPNLIRIYKSGSHEPNVSTFFGAESLQAVKEDIKKNALYLKTIFCPTQYYMRFSLKETKSFALALHKRGITMHSLYPNDAAGRELCEIESEFGFKIKFLPKNYSSSVNVLIYNKTVGFISYENLFGVIIENEHIADAHGHMFNQIWNTAHKSF